MPASLVRFNISALIATIRVLPDMEIAATSAVKSALPELLERLPAIREGADDEDRKDSRLEP